MRIISVILSFFVCVGLYGQNNSIALSQMRYAPGGQWQMITTDATGKQFYITQNLFDIDTRITAASFANDTLTLTVSRVSGQNQGVIGTIAVHIPIPTPSGTLINAGAGITVTGDGSAGNPFIITNTSPDQIVSITAGGINTISGTYPNFTVTGTEVDGSVTNEGRLGVGAGGANTATLTTNTSGSNAVTFAGLTGIAITESTSTNGGTINITNTAPDQTVTINAGTGISSTGSYPNFTITNTAPDQTVVINGSTGITASGTYPTFNFSVADQSPTNELQTLALSNDTLSISSGNFVVLPPSGGGVDTATFLFQDSILIYSVSGIEFGRDTIRTPGGGGPGSVDTLNYLAIVSDTLFVGDTRDTLSVFLDYYPNSNPAGYITSFTDTSGYNQAFYINSDTLYIEDGLTGYGVYLGNYINTDTSGYNNLFSLSGQTLSIGDYNDTLTVTLPIVGVSAGTGISVNTTAGVATVTNTAPDQTVTLTGQAGINTSGTYPAFTIAADTAGVLATQYFVTSQGYTTNTGTVTSVSGTGTVNGITLTGTVTSSGNLTLGGTLSNVNLTSQVTGTLPVGNGGTGATTLTGVLIGNGTGAVTAVAGTANQLIRRNGTNTGYEFFTPTYGNGTVTSVGLSLPAQFNVTNSPVTGAGTLTGAWINQNANLVFAGPSSGGAAAPTFRSLVANDIPDLSATYYPTSNPSGYITSDTATFLFQDTILRYYANGTLFDSDTIRVPGGGGGEVNTASNVGGGYGVFKQKSGVDLQFKTLVPGYGITIDSTADNVTINRREYMEPWDTTATSYTLQLSDASRGLIFTSGSAVAIEIPLNSTVAFPVGQLIHITRYGAGEVTIDGAVGVTLNSASGFKRINYRYQMATLWQVALDEWLLISDLKN